MKFCVCLCVVSSCFNRTYKSSVVCMTAACGFLCSSTAKPKTSCAANRDFSTHVFKKFFENYISCGLPQCW